MTVIDWILDSDLAIREQFVEDARGIVEWLQCERATGGSRDVCTG